MQDSAETGYNLSTQNLQKKARFFRIQPQHIIDQINRLEEFE